MLHPAADTRLAVPEAQLDALPVSGCGASALQQPGPMPGSQTYNHASLSPALLSMLPVHIKSCQRQDI